jgi:DNA-binding XRE family transcriptional regulator
MARNLFESLTEEERAWWASQVKRLRQERSLSQSLLATEAKISRQTLISIEKGDVVPQIGTLKRLLNTLGVDTDEVEFDHQTQLWLTTMGTLIETIPDSRRGRHVDMAIGALAAGIKEPNNVTQFPTHVGSTPDYEAPEYQAVASDMEGGPEEDD